MTATTDLMRKLAVGVVLVLAAVSGAAGDTGRFPKFNEIPTELLFPKNAQISVDRHGNLLFNGAPRHLIGTEIGLQQLAADLRPSAGYDRKLYRWLYEETLNYENSQRLGLDSVAVFIPDWWIKTVEPADRPQYFRDPANDAMIRTVLTSGLPILADFTCFPWRHGRLTRPALRHVLPAEAFNSMDGKTGNHWVPYNIFHPAAREIYRRYWQFGARLMRDYQATVLAYELFNEPAYNDPSPYNRKLFAEFLRRKYDSPAEMNRVWRSRYESFEAAAAFKAQSEFPGLAVDWGKFLEAGFTDLARLGVAAIREIDPQARITFQMLGYNCYRTLPNTNINIFEINRFMDVISTSTVGGVYVESAVLDPPATAVEAPSNATSIGEGILERHFYRCIAPGKPIVNPEAYFPNNPAVLLGKLWIDLLRGSSADYIFSWQKRAWVYGFDEKKGRQTAEQFSYMMINPFVTPAPVLSNYFKGKREIAEFAEFFVPRQRRPRAEIAILISFPTERYGTHTGNIAKNEVGNYAAALELSHYPIDVLVEEQLPEGKLRNYKVVVAVGVENLLPGSAAQLREFVRGGGTLIAARRLMNLDEYGNPAPDQIFEGLTLSPVSPARMGELNLQMPRPGHLRGRLAAQCDLAVKAAAGWQPLGTAAGENQLFRRRLGRGQLIFLAPRMTEYALAGVLGTLLESAGVVPDLRLYRVPQGDLAVNIEAHSAVKDGLKLAVLFNYDPYNKLIELELPSGHTAAADLIGKRRLPVSGRRARILLEANSRAIIGTGAAEALEGRFGALTPLAVSEQDERFNALETARMAAREEARRRENSYSPDLSRTVMVDLRRFANSSFTDDKAGDGEGGWTDEGRQNCLENVPWGVQTLRGVPCELIRFDSNDDKSCIILSSPSSRRKLPDKVEGIPINDRVKDLYFFHTCGYGRRDMHVADYRINYADGGKLVLPVRTDVELDDWWTKNINTKSMRRHLAWENLSGRGFYIWRWSNPEPGREVASVDLISTGSAAIPIIIAMTYEKYTGEADELNCGRAELKAFGGCELTESEGVYRIRVNTATRPYAGVGVKLGKTPVDWRRLPAGSVLKFKANGGFDTFGNRRGGQRIQIKLDKRWSPPALDADPETFEEIEVPVALLLAPGKTGNPELLIQFRGTGADSGVEFKDFRLELGK